MTPIEAAVKVGRKRFDGHGSDCESMAYAAFDADDARAIITAFLDAAARDAAVCERVVEAFGKADWQAQCGGHAAILALKEAVNGG